MLERIRYHAVPPAFILFFTFIVQYLAIKGKGENFTVDLMQKCMLGNTTSWIWSVIIVLWGAVSLKVPAKDVKGPETSFGVRPIYKGNGFQYYCFTLIIYILMDQLFPVSASLYENFPQLLGSFNIIAMLLCIFLLIKGKVSPTHKNDKVKRDPLLYEFYRGMELHPTVFGLDIKQLTNCRIGLMGWQIFIHAFFVTSVGKYGFNHAVFVNYILQTVYLAKFFWWEAGYFYTLDMMFDRAGYYICWGCLVWVPCLYTYSSYYIVQHQPSLQTNQALLFLIAGLLSITLNYLVDYEKQKFRNAKDYKCKIWGKEASFIRAEYVDGKGRKKTSALLTSGFWGISRHMNYTFELLAAFSWCGVGGFENAPMVHLYFIFLFGLLIHRTFRDEDKCEAKYKRHWKLYCEKVPYRLLPYIW
ncbi:UNVERIFIED_CONTAM: hypothetical protein PYX00_003407 [Menopon gallinae]